MDGRDAMIAIGMNGEALPLEHGFPARLVVPGLYGYVSATKWLRTIELNRWSDAEGYWVPLGWARDGPIKTESRIDVPRSSTKLAAGADDDRRRRLGAAPRRRQGRGARRRRPVAGGDAGHRRHRRHLAAVVDRRGTATSGQHTLQVRATDKTGETQTERGRRPGPERRHRLPHPARHRRLTPLGGTRQRQVDEDLADGGVRLPAPRGRRRSAPAGSASGSPGAARRCRTAAAPRRRSGARRPTFSSIGRGAQRGAHPVGPLRQQQPDVDVASSPPPISPTWTIVPRGATTCRLRLISSPPMTSSTVSKPVGHGGLGVGRPVVRRAFEHDVGAELAARVGLARRAGDGDARSDRLGDLDRRGADARRAGVHQRPAARRQPALEHERVPRGEEHLGDRRGVLDRRPTRARPAAGARARRSARRTPPPASMAITRRPAATSAPARRRRRRCRRTPSRGSPA